MNLTYIKEDFFTKLCYLGKKSWHHLTYIYIYTYVCVCVYIYIYIYVCMFGFAYHMYCSDIISAL